MSHHCHQGHCHTHDHSDHEHSCCSQHQCQCKCHESSCHGTQGSFSHQLLQMADEAWMCLLKDKIKAKIQNISGDQLDQLADLVANSNHERWINKMASKRACESFDDKIADFFHQKK